MSFFNLLAKIEAIIKICFSGYKMDDFSFKQAYICTWRFFFKIVASWILFSLCFILFFFSIKDSTILFIVYWI